MHRTVFFITFLLLTSACNQYEADSDPQSGGAPTHQPTASFSLETVQIGHYTLDIYTPVAAHPGGLYPVVYLNDGDSFSTTISSLTSYRFDGNGTPEPFMMVGIHTGPDRTSRYTPYEDEWITDNWGAYRPDAAAYSNDLVQLIIPYIEEHHAANPTRRALFGFSLSGLHAAWMGLNYPDVFSFIGAVSPSFWVADYRIFNEPGNTAGNTAIYFDIGTSEWNNYVPFIASLESAGHVYGENIFYYEVPGGRHVEMDWAQRISIPLLLFLQGPPQEVKSYDLEIECIPSQRVAGLIFQRLNPIINFTNGVKYSLATSASFQHTGGEGEILPDGRFDVTGVNMSVEVSHKEWSEVLTLSDCR